MNIKQYSVIRFEYVLKVDGEVVSRTEPGKPKTILTHFAPDLPKGLEAALVGKSPGEYAVTVLPEQAYGPYNPALRVQAKASDLPEPPRVGGGFEGEGPDGQALLYRVVEVSGEDVTLDANPELAGKTLRYTFTVHKVRPADRGEVEHGHVHGEGGVVHHDHHSH